MLSHSSTPAAFCVARHMPFHLVVLKLTKHLHRRIKRAVCVSLKVNILLFNVSGVRTRTEQWTPVQG